MSVRVAVRHFVAHVILVVLAVSCVVALGVNGVDARGPVAAGEPIPVQWDCLAEGWQAGDVFGPDPADVVPSAPPCPVVTPEPSGADLATDSEAQPQLTLPPTDTR